MDKYYLIVAGAGETSRANIEALIEDYIYANGQDVIFVLPYEKKPSQGQIFAAQLAKDKSKDILLFCREDANYEGIPSSSVSHSDRPFDSACAKLKGVKSVAFVLVDDESQNTNKILAVFQEYNVPTFDLTEGLVPIKFNPKSLEEPEEEPAEMPAAEVIEEDEPEEEEYEEDEEDDIEDFEESIEADELVEDALYGLQALAKLIAKEVVAELLHASEKPSKGSEG